MAELAADYPAVLQLGNAFYGRLLAKSDAALEMGNLPRTEVEQGSEEFRQRMASAS